MLRIRFSRTGKVGQPSYRIVVAEHRAPVKGRYIEIVGNYLPARNPKVVTIENDRITYWISKGALPTDSVAALLKSQGMTNMEKYLSPRDKKRSKKGEEAQASAPVAPATPKTPPAATETAPTA